MEAREQASLALFLIPSYRKSSRLKPRYLRLLQTLSSTRAAAEDLLDVVPEWARFDVEEVVQLACRVNVNAHGLRDDSGSNLVVGVGLFPLTAMINHSCRPNCTFVYFGEILVACARRQEAKAPQTDPTQVVLVTH